MDKQLIFLKVSHILQDLREIEQPTTLDTVLLGKGGMLDSLSAFRFITAVESTFQIEMDDDDINFDNLRTIGTLVDYIGDVYT